MMRGMMARGPDGWRLLLMVFVLVATFTYTLAFIVLTTPIDASRMAVYDLDDPPPPPPPARWTDALLQFGGARKARELQDLLSTRVCGSPALDGYSHVKPDCLVASPANQWWNRTRPQPDDLQVHLELHADYDGLAVVWGIGNKMSSLEACAEACRRHVPRGDGPYGWLPCNAFSWCSEAVCFEPDVHTHTQGDCWLKFSEGPASPEVNMRGKISAAQRQRHPSAPEVVPWHSGVLLPKGVKLLEGTWSPRYNW